MIGPGTSSGSGAVAFGAAGQGTIRNLGVAFTRAIPIAISGDPAWATTLIGSAGGFDLTVTIDDAGKIVSAVPRPLSIAPHLQHLIDRTLTFLRAGRFSLSQAGVSAGIQTLRISALVSDVAGGVDPGESSAGPFALGFEPPSDGRPGKAYFTLRSGRHVEVLVTVLPPP